MSRLLSVALAGLVVVAGFVLAQPPGIQKGKVKKIDFEKMIVTLTVDGKDQEFTLTEETRILGGEGKTLKERMKDIKEGSAVFFKPVSRGGKEAIMAMKLDDGKGPSPGGGTATGGKTSVGYKPLTEMSADDKYKGEDGGLYGAGKNEPPAEHQAAAKKETTKIVPLDADGKPAKDGKIVLISMSMSNATQEFSYFVRIAKDDQDKSPRLTIVDCAQGGQAMAAWANSDRPWQTAEKRLSDAGVTPKQVQVVWVKLANPGPRGDLAEHGKKLKSDTLKVLQRAKETFPNLRIAYLGSRIYGGYAAGQLNPEPYAYEGAFVVRWLIQDQIKGGAELNYDAGKGAVKAPLLLWGPYFWADGIKPRKSDGLIWERKDLSGDGTHPSEAGRKKVAEMLLKFFKEDALAKSWFVK
jgi:hypothetical protein